MSFTGRWVILLNKLRCYGHVLHREMDNPVEQVCMELGKVV